MLSFLTWYLILALFGLAALPLGWTWFHALPDRGWGLLRPLGLLLVGVAVWLAGSVGLVTLGIASGLGALALLALGGLWVLHRWGGGGSALRDWLRANWDTVLLEELLFLVLLFGWVWFRIHDAEGIQNTERPMDFALYRAILRGGEIPPGDPWMSGFAISYYYLGYFIMAQVTALGGIVPGIGFNLSLASLAALTGGAAFTVSFGMLAGVVRRQIALPLAALAVVLILGISNLTGIANTAFYKGMWPDSWFPPLRVADLSFNEATGQRNISGWWWWASSRTVSDYGPDGGRTEIIDEFPFFSFLLGDMHPHVLALPFATLAIGIALNALRAGRAATPRRRGRLLLPPDSWAVGGGFGLLTLLLSAVVIGAMAMLNTWDFPTQLLLAGAVWLIAITPTLRLDWRRWLPSLGMGLGALALLALLVYLPFYISFRSQASGIGLTPIPTMPQHYLLMFGLFLVVAFPFVLALFLSAPRPARGEWPLAATVAAMLLVSVLALAALLRTFGPANERLPILIAALWLLIPLGIAFLLAPSRLVTLVVAQLSLTPALVGVLWQRWTLFGVGILLFMALATLALRLRPRASEPPRRPIGDGLLFALLLLALALLLTMGPEMLFVRDLFGNRMNTVFKLYYQGWLLVALATPFALAWLARRWRWASLLVIVPFTLLLVGSMWYPLETIRTKSNHFAAANWDGTFWLERADADRAAAIRWLDAQPGTLVVTEAPGDSYQPLTSALSAYTGHATLLGWGWHEVQWRGDSNQNTIREAAIQQIYTDLNAETVMALLDQYDVDVVAVTPTERAKYALTEEQAQRFRDFMTLLFEQGGVALYGR